MYRAKPLIFVTIVMILISAFAVIPAQAEPQGPPVGTCPPGFEMHHFMHHEHHHDHHIGLAQDLNQDGLICVKHLPNGLHVHVDNVLP
jgi:hypothetical protein